MILHRPAFLITLVFLTGVSCYGSKDSRADEWRAGFLSGLGAIPQPDTTEAFGLSLSHQINPGLFFQLGQFYFDGDAVPSVTRLTDLAVAFVRNDIRPAGLDERSPVVLWLDGDTGTLVYTTGPASYGFIQNSAILKGAKSVELSPLGRILIVGADRRLNACYHYERGVIQTRTTCQFSIAVDRARFFTGGNYDLVAHDGDQVFFIDSASGAKSAPITHGLTGPVVGVAPIPPGFAVIAENGLSVGLFNSGGIRRTTLRTPTVEYDDGGSSTPIRITDLGLEDAASFVAVSGDILIRMDPAFNAVRATRMPSLPLPMLRLQFLRGIYADPVHRGLYVYANNGFSVYDNSRPSEPDFPSAPIPDSLRTVEAAARENLSLILAWLFENPSQDLLENPQLKRALEEAKNQL